MFAAVLADFGRPLPTFRIELPVASIFLKRLWTPLLDHLLDGNSRCFLLWSDVLLGAADCTTSLTTSTEAVARVQTFLLFIGAVHLFLAFCWLILFACCFFCWFLTCLWTFLFLLFLQKCVLLRWTGYCFCSHRFSLACSRYCDSFW